MAQTIKIKNSGTSGNTPSSLAHGELALNYNDGKLFYKNASGSIVEFTTSATGSFLPLSGGTLTGTLLGTNAAFTGKVAVGNSGVHPSYHFYNNQNSYFNGSVVIDDALSITGSNAALSVAGNISLDANDAFVYLSNVGTGNSGIYVRGRGTQGTLRSHTTTDFRWEIGGSERAALNTTGFNTLGTYTASGNINTTSGGYQIGGTAVITSGKVLQNVTGNISMFTNDSGYITSASLPTVNNGTLTLATSGTGLSGSASFTANQSGNSTYTVTLTSAENGASKILRTQSNGYLNILNWINVGNTGLFSGTIGNHFHVETNGWISKSGNATNSWIRMRTNDNNTRGFVYASSSSYIGFLDPSQNWLFQARSNGDLYQGNGNGLIWHSANDGANSGLDADLLDGQHGSYYLNYNNFSNTPSIPSVGNGTLTVTAGNSLTGGGSFTANQSSSSSVTLGIDTPDDAGTGGWYRLVAWNNQLIYDDAVRLHGAGYLKASYLNMSHSASNRTSDTVFYSSTDDYIRKNTQSGFRTSLDVYSKSEVNGLGFIKQGTNAFGNSSFSNAIGEGFRFQRVTGGTNRATTSHHNVLQIPNTSGDIYLAQMAFGTDASATKLAWRSKGTSFGSWYDIWHSGNDGSGSGLDADTLDGFQSGYFATQGNLGSYLPLSGGTMTGTLKIANGTQAAPSLSFGSDTDTGIYRFASNHLGFTVGGALRLVIDASGGISSYNTIFARKDNVTNYTDAQVRLDSFGGASSLAGLGFHISGQVGRMLFMNNQAKLYWNSTSSELWHASNDGSGSGLDADTLDGQHGAYYLNYNHLTNTPSQLPANGGNADTVDNLHANNSSNTAADALVRTQANGYIFTPFINTTSGDNGTTTPTRFYASSDNYIRYYDWISMKSFMNSPYSRNLWHGREQDGTSDTNYHTGSIGWGTTFLNDTTAWDVGSGFLDNWSQTGANSVGGSGSHFLAMQAMHYSAGTSTSRYGFRIINQAGTSNLYFQRTWNSGVTTHRIWNAGTDGSGSGLDADTVDGVQLANIARTDVAETFTSNVTVNNNLYMGDGNDGYFFNDTNGRTAFANGQFYFQNTVTNFYNYAPYQYHGDSSGTTHYFRSNVLSGTGWGIDGAGKLNTRDHQLNASYVLMRSDHHSGHLEGSYNNVGANGAKTNPIYTIGSSYNPNDSTLGNMYGVGFASSASASYLSFTGASNWGLYVAADGDARVFLDGSNGVVSSTGQHYVGSNVVWNAGNDGAGSGLDADTLDGAGSGSFLRSDANDTMNNTLTFASTAGLDTATNDVYANMRVIRNNVATGNNADGLYIGYSNNNSGATRIYGGGATTGGIRVNGSGNNDIKMGSSSGTAWHSANDGSGSGLDADTLDGYQSGYFATQGNLGNYLPLSGGTLTGNISHASDLTFDVGGNLILDADGGTIDLMDGGTRFGRLQQMIGGLGISAGSTPTFAQLISSTKTLFFGHIELGDNKHVQWGNGSGDLKIYHDGSNSYIQEFGTGNLYITSDNGNINLQTNASENAVKCVQNSSVFLYHDGDERFRTHSYGGSLTGSLAVSQQVWSGGNQTHTAPAYAFNNDTNTGMFRKSSDVIGFSTGGTERATIDSDGLKSNGVPVATVEGGSTSKVVTMRIQAKDLDTKITGGGYTFYNGGTNKLLIIEEFIAFIDTNNNTNTAAGYPSFAYPIRVNVKTKWGAVDSRSHKDGGFTLTKEALNKYFTSDVAMSPSGATRNMKRFIVGQPRDPVAANPDMQQQVAEIQANGTGSGQNFDAELKIQMDSYLASTCNATFYLYFQVKFREISPSDITGASNMITIQ